MSNFFTGRGKTIKIGRELGKGGEGSVYEVVEHQHLVAKLYNKNHLPDAHKQAKLRFMVDTADKELASYAAWPQDTLHTARNGGVVGFLMPRVAGRVPIHMVYSPAHRRQEYPDKAWDFLLYIARNTAAAFTAIHSHSHVVGDVNQSNVMVGADAKVMLIDTDSFQINARGTTHLCNVGVAHFTPPELQGNISFNKVIRTSNHDNFGLALLIFHLLFGGRHPFSGVPLTAGAGEALEKDIQAFRYAYSSDGPKRGLKPPPKSLPISLVPVSLQALFTLAFTENGSQLRRPTAQQWVSELDMLRGRLRRCGITSMHVYPEHLNRCPWCDADSNGVVYFIDTHVEVATATESSVAIARIWAAIEAVLPPPEIPLPNIAMILVEPTPLPPNLSASKLIIGRVFLAIIWICFLAALLYWIPQIFILISFFFIPVVGLIWAAKWRSSDFNFELARRQADFKSAQVHYNAVINAIQTAMGHDTFLARKQNLVNLRDEYEQMPALESVELEKLRTHAKARQLQLFLERFFIDSAEIYGVGPTKKAALKSFGIETAADVTRAGVKAVPGFGEVLTQAVVDWRNSCEGRFKFNPALALSTADKSAVRQKFLARRREIEAAMVDGLNDLRKMRQDAIDRSAALRPSVEAASLRLVQARADLSVMEYVD